MRRNRFEQHMVDTGHVYMFPEHLRVFGFWRGLWVWLRYDIGPMVLVCAGGLGFVALIATLYDWLPS